MADGTLKQQFEKSKEEFLLVEVESGHTFAEVARDALDAERRKRNIANARKAHDTLVYFLRDHGVEDAGVKKKIEDGLASLKRELTALGVEL